MREGGKGGRERGWEKGREGGGERSIYCYTIYNLTAHLLSVVMLLLLAANKKSSILSIKKLVIINHSELNNNLCAIIIWYILIQETKRINFYFMKHLSVYIRTKEQKNEKLDKQNTV